MPQKLELEASVCLVDKKLGMMHFVWVCDIGSLTHQYSVALARAVYARTKYVLLDGPLSAVVCTLLNIFKMIS